jgi:uncharacterized membrane protein
MSGRLTARRALWRKMREIEEASQLYGEGLPAPSVAGMVACGVALGTLVPVLLHQVGVLGHLPDPPGAVFDSDRITESHAAHPFGVPDAALGLASYSVTLALLLAARSQPKARPLLALKLAADGGLAGFNMVRQLVQFRRVCSWCTGTAIATAVMVYAEHELWSTGADEVRSAAKTAKDRCD